MTSTFLPLNIGMSGIEAMTQAEGVVGNNISNANNPAYVRETSVIESGLPYQLTTNATISQGVDIPQVQRETNQFTIKQDRQNQGAYQMYSTLSSSLSQIESILNEPSKNGIQNSLDQFFTAWQKLSSDPTNSAARQSVIAQAKAFAQTYQTVTSQLEQMKTNLNSVVYGSPNYQVGSGGTQGIASNVEVLSSVQSTTGSFNIVFNSVPNGSGGTTHTIQLKSGAKPPQNIGSAVTVTSATGTYTIGNANGPLVSVTMNPSFNGSSATGTYSQTDSFTPPGGQVQELNQYAYQVNQLNQQITKAETNKQTPNTLLDQRAHILDEMANISNISYQTSPDNSVSVSIGTGTNAVSLVNSGGGVTPLSIPVSDYTSSGNALSDLNAVTAGSLAGNTAGINDVQGVLGQINSFLTSFSNEVNSVQTGGYSLNSPGTPTAMKLFSSTTDSAGNVVLSLYTDPTTGKTVSTRDIAASGKANQTGDNSNADAMVQLQNQSIPFTNPGGSPDTTLNGTFDQATSQIVSNIGVEANSVKSSEETANALAQQSSNMRQSVSGVDTNQQAALMIQYQNSYDAAAKYVSTFNSMLQALMNMVP